MPGQEGYTEKNYSLAQLFTHLASDCKLKLTICPSCKLTLESATATSDHISKDCPEVPIQCDTCSKSLARGKFREHICYIKHANFRDVIELKHDVNTKLEEKNTALAAEVADNKSKAAEAQRAYEQKIRELERQLDEYETKHVEQTDAVAKSMKPTVTNAEYAKAARLAPTHIKRRYSVAVNTCFRCCQDKLANDLIHDASDKSKINSDYYF